MFFSIFAFLKFGGGGGANGIFHQVGTKGPFSSGGGGGTKGLFHLYRGWEAGWGAVGVQGWGHCPKCQIFFARY